MSGTRQVDQTIIGKHPGEDDAEAQRFFNQKIVLPVVLAMRDRVNQLTGDFLAVTFSQFVEPRYAIVPVDASGGAVTVTLRAPSSSHHEYFFVKTDASLNPVTIRSENGELISGAATFVMSNQWEAAILASDATAYYVTGQFGETTVTAEPSIFVNISTDQDNYSPTGWSSARRVFLNVTSACSINGFDANVTQPLKTLFHVGTAETPLGLKEQKLSSTAANRIEVPLPNDVYLLKDWVQDIWYDTTVSRWRPV